MKRLLLYVHFNKHNKISSHVYYQLEHMRPLFSKLVFITNSQLSEDVVSDLFNKSLIDDFIQRENKGYDFAAWHDGMMLEGFESLKTYDSVTVMNDTCFGPLWDMYPYYERYENDDSVDFWGMTNHQGIRAGDIYIDEHLQSYFISFKHRLLVSDVFQDFWKNVQSYTDVQKVIDNYETKYTKIFREVGFNYASVLNTLPLNKDFFHSNFSIHYPHVLIDSKVPFIKVKTFDLIQHLAPYTIQAIEDESDYPVALIVSHLSKMNTPTHPYLLGRKYLKVIDNPTITDKKVAVHLHAYYLDLVDDFLIMFENFYFAYDLYLTTDSEEKKSQIIEMLAAKDVQAKVFVTGAKGRDIVPMLKLKEQLSEYDYIGHFHTKKSPEYPHWVGDSWRKELFDMMLKQANQILASFDASDDLGLAIADIPSFFRYTRIVEPWNENKFANGMNALWQRMNLPKQLDFNSIHTFIMSYGTFIWFKYDALKPLFDLNITDDEIPAEPLPQHTVLHSIERLLVYIAWANDYDYIISENSVHITPFVDNTVLNLRADLVPATYINFDQIGGIKGALKYIIVGPGTAVKYILRRIKRKLQS